MAAGAVNQPALLDMPRPHRRVRQSGGTDVTVGDGGTGRSSHTDGGLLIGKGSSAIENTGVLADGELVVGDGTTNPVLESGDTLRISIGVGSTSSPRFTGIELGAASDNTLTRASAGDMNIEGNIVYRAGGTDVAVADGGTGGPDYAGKSLIINGDMRIAQRGASFTTLTASQYTLDRWEWIDTGTTAVVVTVTQDADVPTVAEAGTKFANSLKIDVTTAENLGSADAAVFLSHKIEAQDCAHFGHGAAGAKSGRLSFWFKSTKTGIFTVNVDRDDASEKYSTEFTVGATNTWEKHEVTVPGDTNGTAIADDNGIGLALQFMLAVGGDGDTSTKDAWNASGATELATANQVNLLDNTANNVFITGVKYEVGTVSTKYEHKKITEQLQDCQRYYEELGSGIAGERFGVGLCFTTTTASMVIYYQEKRAIPVVTKSAAGDFDVLQDDATAEAVTVFTSALTGLKMSAVVITVAANLIAGDATILTEGTGGAGTARIKINAEL